jgi:CheY-specific phosphatase CheX
MSELPATPPPEVVEAFTSAAITALQELARVEAFSEPLPPALDAPISGPVVSAAIRLQRLIPGAMTLLLCAEAAAQLAARYLPEGTVLTEDLIDDVAGEFANVIAGQAKTILKGTPYHFTMTTPVVSRGATLAAFPMTAVATHAISLVSEPGRLVLLVDLSPCPNA